MGARFLGVTLFGCIAWFAMHWREYSLGRATVRTLIVAFAGAILGKLVGITVYRLRTRRLRGMVSPITRHSLPAAP
jgi:ABC-type spermidine/putrescine transport system permease subunit II